MLRPRLSPVGSSWCPSHRSRYRWFLPDVAFAYSRHRHRIIRPQRENRSDAARITIRALSGADGPCDHGHTRAVCALPQRTPRTETRWRMTQSAANHSPRSNSLLSREKAGNFADLTWIRRIRRVKTRASMRAICANSLLIGAGNFDCGSGKGNSLLRFRSGNFVAIHQSC